MRKKYKIQRIQDDEEFRDELHHRFDYQQMRSKIGNEKNKHFVFEYPHDKCIECGDVLTYSYRSGSTNKGSIAITFYANQQPQVFTSQLKQCPQCMINYGYGVIEYAPKYKENHRLKKKEDQRVYLSIDRDYFATGGLITANYFHKSVIKEIEFFSFGNKSQSMQFWNQSFEIRFGKMCKRLRG